MLASSLYGMLVYRMMVQYIIFDDDRAGKNNGVGCGVRQR